MSNYDEAALFEDTDSPEDDESYESAESDDEAAEFNILDPAGIFSGIGSLFGGGKGRARAPQVAQGRNYFNPAMPTPFVPRTEFVAAMNKVRSDITKNGAAIKSVGARAASLQTASTQHSRALVKQNQVNVKQSKQIARLRLDMKKAQERAMLMTILMQPKKTNPTTSADTVGGVQVAQGTRFLYETKDSNPLLMLLLLGGMFGGDSGSSSSGGLDPMMMLFMFSGAFN